MKRIILILIMIVFNFTACTNKNSVEPSYIVIDNKNLFFGNTESKNKFQYIEKENGIISKSLVVYIDGDTYKSEPLDLCKKTGEYNLLKSVSEDSNGNAKPNFEKKKINCNSSVEIEQQNNDRYFISYSLNFLTGFNKQLFKGFPLYLSETQTLQTSNILEYNETRKVLTYDNKEVFIYFGENSK